MHKSVNSDEIDSKFVIWSFLGSLSTNIAAESDNRYVEDQFFLDISAREIPRTSRITSLETFSLLVTELCERLKIKMHIISF